MKTLYVLVADKGWAKLYRFSCQSEQLTLVYHQRNWTDGAYQGHEISKLPDEPADSKRFSDDEAFARELCKMLKLDCQAGMFDGLIVFSSREFLAFIYEHLGSECRDRLLRGIVQVPSLLSEQILLMTVRDVLEKQSASLALGGCGGR